MTKAGAAMLAAVMATGCCTHAGKDSFAQPKVIGLAEAIGQVQKAIGDAQKVDAENKIGLLPAKATVTFVMAAEDTHGSSSGGSVGVALPVGVSFEASGENTYASKGTQANTIVIELTNPLLASKETILGQASQPAGKQAQWKLPDWVKPQIMTPGTELAPAGMGAGTQ